MGIISIEETDKEYLLYIPAAQKERAKKIPGRNWDPERVCWVYPRNKMSYDMLWEEFADDIAQGSFPKTPIQVVKEYKDEKDYRIENMKTEIELLKREISFFTSTRNELKPLLDKINKLQSENDKLTMQLNEELVRSSNIEKQLNDKTILIKKSHKNTDYYEQSKLIAHNSTGKDEWFSKEVNTITIDKYFPSEIAKKMETILRNKLNIQENEYNLNDLIKLAKENGLLDDEAYNLAHLLRKQRNIVVHQTFDLRTVESRNLMCLFAASLLWPKLPE